tara:strand:- start:83 stop:511 length:429 start_codon:yes stop_codon:yes gene_type:complete
MTNLNKLKKELKEGETGAFAELREAEKKINKIIERDGKIFKLLEDGSIEALKDRPMMQEFIKNKSKKKNDGVISFEELENKQKNKPKIMKAAKGGLAEATAKLKAKGFNEGGSVIKDKTVAIDKSPNSGLITQRGFGASRRT